MKHLFDSLSPGGPALAAGRSSSFTDTLALPAGRGAAGRLTTADVVPADAEGP